MYLLPQSQTSTELHTDDNIKQQLVLKKKNLHNICTPS